MDFDRALSSNIITQAEYDLLLTVDQHIQYLEFDIEVSENLNEILEKVFQFELAGGVVH